MLKIFNSIERIIFTASPKRLYVVLWLIQLVKTGVWYYPYLYKVLPDPFSMPAHVSYLFYSWLGFFIAWCLHIKTILPFIALNFIFTLGFSWLAFKLLVENVSEDAARIAIILFFFLPISGTLYYWISVDSITLFFMALILYKIDNWSIVILSGIALGLNHFEQSFIAFSALLLVLVFSSAPLKKQIPGLLLSILFGKLCLTVLFYYHHIVIPNRAVWMWQHLPRLWYEFFYSIHVILWSALGLGWMVAIAYAEQGRKSISFFVILFGLFCIIPFVEDQTRVFALISFPILTFCWLKNKIFLNQISKKFMALLCLLWVFLPWSWVWQSAARSSVFPYDVAFVLHETLGWFDIPDKSLLGEWPFVPSQSSMIIPLKSV